MGDRKRFEYTRVGYDHANELGQDGWEAVGIFPNGCGILFKREVIEVDSENFTLVPAPVKSEWAEATIGARFRNFSREEQIEAVKRVRPDLKVIDVGGWSGYNAERREIVINVLVEVE